MLTFYYFHIASNALRSLQGLGLLEAILAKINQTPDRRFFAFISGTGDHELVYDVSLVNATIEISSTANSVLNIVRETWGLESIGIHVPRLFKKYIYFYNQC